MSQDLLNATIIKRKNLAQGLWIIWVRPDTGEIPKFEPGQYAALGYPPDPIPDGARDEKGKLIRKPKLIKRSYSIASSPNENEAVEIFIVLVEEGELTPKLYALQEGDRLWMGNKIKGRFTLDDVPKRKKIAMVSTGTGIAPFISMLRTNRGQDRWKRCVIIHGCRLVEDLGYRDELTRLSEEDPTVTYYPTVTREPEDTGWNGLRGRVNTFLEENAFRELVGESLSPDEWHVMLCGNPDMIVAAQEDLEKRGFKTHSPREPGNVHFESYW